MMEKTTGQLGVLLLLLLTVMGGRSRGHVLVQHRRTHGTLGTPESARAVYTTDVTASTHAAANTARLVALLVFLILHLWPINRRTLSMIDLIVSQFGCSSTRLIAVA